ncbi:glutathione ABC transporter ATP-binding protein GsiA, partial [Erwinia amylovora]|nr:glutathione ABC transporter ATP-binding protein GsiA [Erwinia amylovora]
QPYTRALLAAVPKLGSMSGRDLQAKFPLTDAVATAAEAPQDTVDRQKAPILQVRDLVTRFDIRSCIFNRVKRRVHAVEKVSFDLRACVTLALVGESGC